MTKKSIILSGVAASSALVWLALAAHAADQPAAPASDLSQKPSWLTDLSLGVREGYDDNVFMGGVDPKYLPAYAVPPGSVAALENRSSWVTTVSPKVGVNLVPLLDGQKTLSVLSLAYAPDFIIYHDQPWQNYDAHRFAAAVKGQADHLSFSADNTLAYIDGTRMGPSFPGGGDYFNAWATVAEGQRVEQIQEVGRIALQYDWDRVFVRPTASVMFYDVMSKLLDYPGADGYQNYPDRYDANGGVDFGYKVTPGIALTLGYRYGHQYQEQLPWLSGGAPTDYSSTSDYQRLLFGAEGKPWKWLSMSLQGGPDFRSYDRTAPVNDLHPVKYYGQASVTAEASSKDTVVFYYRQMQWVSICGKIPYFDSRFELSYHRKLCDKLTLDLGARAWEADYTSGNLDTSLRNDMLYMASAGLTWLANSHLSFNLAYGANLGRNLQDMANSQYRDYDQNLVSLGAVLKL
ncbi:MAG: hypothetical protein ABSG59_20515 [Verrucomicrobiota bacterium]|jgi:hypothetical protein